MTDTTVSQPDPTGPVSEGVEVTQADRDAAAAYHDQRYEYVTAEFIRQGERDAGFLVQAFARHRLTSPINSALVEAAREMLDAREEWLEAEEGYAAIQASERVDAAEKALADALAEQDRSTSKGEGA